MSIITHALNAWSLAGGAVWGGSENITKLGVARGTTSLGVGHWVCIIYSHFLSTSPSTSCLAWCEHWFLPHALVVMTCSCLGAWTLWDKVFLLELFSGAFCYNEENYRQYWGQTWETQLGRCTLWNMAGNKTLHSWRSVRQSWMTV